MQLTTSLRFHLSPLASIRAVFLLSGLVLSTWAVMVPFLKFRLGLEEAQLGLFLLSLGVGALSSMPFSGRLVHRFGSYRLLRWLLAPMLVFVYLLSFVPNLLAAVVLAAAFGACFGLTEAIINIQAVALQSEERRPLLSSCHGAYALGCLAGSLGLNAMLSSGIALRDAVLIIVLTGGVLVSVSVPGFVGLHLPPRPERARQRVPARAKGLLVLFAAVSFVLYMVEGGVLDWSGLFLHETAGVPLSSASLGFAMFASAVAVGRLVGDKAISWLGYGPMIVIGSALTAGSFWVLALGADLAVLLAAFFVLGLGVANLVPICFTLVSQRTGLESAAVLPLVTAFGYLGDFVGPAMIGFLAQYLSLATAYAVIGALVVFVVCLERLQAYRESRRPHAAF